MRQQKRDKIRRNFIKKAVFSKNMKSIFNLIGEKDKKSNKILKQIIDEIRVISSKNEELSKKQLKLEDEIIKLKKENSNQNFEDIKTNLLKINENLEELKPLKLMYSQDSDVSVIETEHQINQENESIKELENNKLTENKKNNKSAIKNQLLNTILENETKLNELKELFVNKEKLCSRATFYRYIAEFLKKDLIQNITINEETILIKKRKEINL